MVKASEPIRIGKKICKNRITMAPTVKFASDEEGMVTDEFVKHYEERAKYGAGLIVVEATCINKSARLFPGQLGLWSDDQIEGHRKIAEAVHKYDALVIPQIHHGGLGTHPACGELTSPTKTKWNNGFSEMDARELTIDEIKQIINEFIESAVRAKKAGYDGVQLHACHAYLINDFASNVNKRTDEYGKTLDDKARLGCEIINGIRKACGDDFIISARISGADPSVKESKRIAELYVEAGCDYLQVSCGIAEFDDVPYDESLPYTKIASLGVDMYRHFRGIVPVSTVNGLRDVSIVRYMLENDLVDTVDLACGLLADPRFSEAILDENSTSDSYVKCYNCKDCAFGPMHAHPCPAMKKRGAREFAIIPE